MSSTSKQPWKPPEEPIFLSQRFQRTYQKLKPIRKTKTNSADSSRTSLASSSLNLSQTQSSSIPKDNSLNHQTSSSPVLKNDESNEVQDESRLVHSYAPFQLSVKSSFSPTSIKPRALAALPLFSRAKYSAYMAPPAVRVLTYELRIWRQELENLGTVPTCFYRQNTRIYARSRPGPVHG